MIKHFLPQHMAQIRGKRIFLFLFRFRNGCLFITFGISEISKQKQKTPKKYLSSNLETEGQGMKGIRK